MGIGTLVLLVNLAATWFMVGLIWFVQLVHYPQFDGVGADGFRAYHARHTRATTRVVAGPMLVELLTAAALPFVRPDAVAAWVAWVGLALAGVAWASTALLQVPRHGRLAGGFDSATCATLCGTNWVRTAAWTARGALMLWAAAEVVGPL